MYEDISLSQFVIPGLTRNPVFFWIPAFAGMTSAVVINDAVYRLPIGDLKIENKKSELGDG
jgi:hypothetical protein